MWALWLTAALAGSEPADAEAYRAVHSTELAVLHRVDAIFPAPGACALHVFIDVSGMPAAVVPREDCPAELVAPSLAAISEWRWDPLAIDGTAGPFQTWVKLQVAEPAPEPEAVPFVFRDLQLLRRVMPIYPDHLREEWGDRVECKMRLFIDAEGVPYDVVYESCPMDFRPSVEEAVSKWRWRPAVVKGVPVRAQFLLTVSFAGHERGLKRAPPP